MLLRHLTPGQSLVVDGLFAVAVAVLGWYAAVEVPQPPATGPHEPAWVSVAVGVALGAPVAIRRLWPVPAAVAAFAVAALALATDLVPDYASAGPLVAVGTVLYTVGGRLPARRSLPVLAGGLLVIAVALAVSVNSPFGPGGLEVAFAALVLGASWAVGWTVRERRAYAARTVEQAAERAVREERLRIAREMHDVVAHSMGLIAVKAMVADHVAEERPQEVREALRVIEATSRGALADLRRVLASLRLEAPLAPTPGLADLPALVERTRSAGVPVELDVRGDGTVPEGVGLSAYRIVQEALTNVLRHAGSARCRVEVRAAPGELCLTVTDDGRPKAGVPAGGQGLVGMRERVALYRGEFAAGPGPDGGFQVRARLPYGEPA
ncbi:sensor histidine kinase [Micromonospora sp. PLK6-60]|nr:sensor histidine kinase [Micromonospora sp. PLK6-60]